MARHRVKIRRIPAPLAGGKPKIFIKVLFSSLSLKFSAKSLKHFCRLSSPLKQPLLMNPGGFAELETSQLRHHTPSDNMPALPEAAGQPNGARRPAASGPAF
jgi:hypothetical protein